ncbi:MAG: MarR family winged helix-turn-helix transcriptional regulator [Chloroflexota bacterium]|nr:MarR family winged helix-turn-helix transcriptional regulator [Chloroflexota bacterium]
MKREQETIEQIRSFNRFYTDIIGLLDQHFLDSPFSLTEGRVLYEIQHIEDCTAKKIREKINIDEGYLSRILNTFKKMGLITKSLSPDDKRLHIIKLTEKGRKEFASLNDHSDQLISRLIEKLSAEEREELLSITERIRHLLGRDQA